MAVNELKARGVRSRSQIVNRISVSVLVGAVAFLVSKGLDSEMGAPTILSIGVSVFIGGVAFVTQFLIESDRRIDVLTREVSELRATFAEHANDVERNIRREFAAVEEQFTKINAATELFGLVEASALKTDAMTQLVKNSTTIAVESPSKLIFDFAQSEIARLSGYLRDLGQKGDVTYEGEDRDWLLGLTRAASLSIDATSLTTVDAGGRGFVDGGLWISDLGRRYLEAQKQAIGRGVIIRRIFIMDRQELQNSHDLVDILNEQVNVGVKIRILDPRRVSLIRRSSLVDFIVVDNVLVYRSGVASRVEEDSYPIIESTRLVTDPDQVRDRVDRYAELWVSARDYIPLRPGRPDEDVVDPGDDLGR